LRWTLRDCAEENAVNKKLVAIVAVCAALLICAGIFIDNNILWGAGVVVAFLAGLLFDRKNTRTVDPDDIQALLTFFNEHAKELESIAKDHKGRKVTFHYGFDFYGRKQVRKVVFK
jgi:hypothetical protein